MSFGGRVRELLLELKRSDWMPIYSEDAVNRCLQEVKGHWEEIKQILSGGDTDDVPPEYKVALTVHMENIMRIKRCLLAYTQHRLDKIREVRWETGPVLPPSLECKLSARESEFFSSYDRLLAEYMTNYPALDLSTTTQPPKEVSIEVRVLKDCGEVMTEQGPVSLEKGTHHFLRRADVETLIRQGYLEHIESGEAF